MGRRSSSAIALDTTNAVTRGHSLRVAGHHVQPSFLVMASDASSVYRKKGVDAAAAFERLTELNFAAAPMRGEGMEGLCLERGEPETTILSHWVANPELAMQDR
jgi:hypothetical protein